MNVDSIILGVIITERTSRIELEAELTRVQSELSAVRGELERVSAEFPDRRDKSTADSEEESKDAPKSTPAKKITPAQDGSGIETAD